MNLPEHWSARLKAGHFPNAVLVTKDAGAAAATDLAAAYLCAKGAPACGLCLHCRKLAAGIHPDFVRTEGIEALKVDAIRALRKDAYIRPNEADRKVYLLGDAEALNSVAQNALLKLLEEGPAYAAFFFLTRKPEALLPTLRSRCETLCATGEVSKPAQGEAIERFVSLLCALGEGGSMSLLSFCIGLEKQSRLELSAFLDSSIEVLIQRLPEAPAHLLPKLETLRQTRAACEYNIGVGHLTGLLLAGLL